MHHILMEKISPGALEKLTKEILIKGAMVDVEVTGRPNFRQ